MNKTLFVDLDSTLGFYDGHFDSWIVYDGALEAMRLLKEKIPLVLLTANRAANVQKLFREETSLAASFANVITCEDFAPHFIRITDCHKHWVRSGKIDSKVGFLNFIHELWKVDPAEVMPAGVAPQEDVSRLFYEEWERKIYFPFIAPNKAVVCGASGLLIDDEFSRPHPNPLYKQMMREGRTFFAGPRGGVTPDSGPHWPQIVELVSAALE